MIFLFMFSKKVCVNISCSPYAVFWSCPIIVTKPKRHRLGVHRCSLPDALLATTGLPVYDSITCCNFFISGMQDNERFGTKNLGLAPPHPTALGNDCFEIQLRHCNETNRNPIMCQGPSPYTPPPPRAGYPPPL